MDRRGLAEEVIRIVRHACAAVLEVYRADFDVYAKRDGSPLTAADRASHQVIRDGLAALTADIPLLSEEAEITPFAVRRSWRRHWLVDPLDGTKEFIGRNGEFTVNVALVEDHRPVLGVVGVPVAGTIFVGIVPERLAEKRMGERRERIGCRPVTAGRPLALVESRSHAGERLEHFVEVLKNRFSDIERIPSGSSLKICHVAEGKADIYPRLGPTSEWDTGAAQAVLEAAGGAVWTLETDGAGGYAASAPVTYNVKESPLNADFVCVGDPSYPWFQ